MSTDRKPFGESFADSTPMRPSRITKAQKYVSPNKKEINSDV